MENNISKVPLQWQIIVKLKLVWFLEGQLLSVQGQSIKDMMEFAALNYSGNLWWVLDPKNIIQI